MTLLLTSSVEGVLLVLAGVVAAGGVTTLAGSCRVVWCLLLHSRQMLCWCRQRFCGQLEGSCNTDCGP